MIKITYTAIDGYTKTRSFKSLDAARHFAIEYVGSQDVEGGHYAVSDDGVGKIVWSGVTRAKLFGNADQAGLNKVTTFYRNGDKLFCRQAGYTRDHEGQLFGRVVEVMDNVTGDNHDGWRLRNLDCDCRNLLDEETRFATREAAMASAKQTMIDYLDYLNDSADYVY